jgi:hypothetical protein
MSTHLIDRIADCERAITILAQAIIEMPKPLTHADETGVTNNAVLLLASAESSIADAVEYHKHHTGGGGHS